MKKEKQLIFKTVRNLIVEDKTKFLNNLVKNQTVSPLKLREYKKLIGTIKSSSNFNELENIMYHNFGMGMSEIFGTYVL